MTDKDTWTDLRNLITTCFVKLDLQFTESLSRTISRRSCFFDVYYILLKLKTFISFANKKYLNTFESL